MDIGGAPLAPGMATKSGDSGSTSPGTTIVMETHPNFRCLKPSNCDAYFLPCQGVWISHFLVRLDIHGNPLHGWMPYRDDAPSDVTGRRQPVMPLYQPEELSEVEGWPITSRAAWWIGSG
jgi:hypothetical protein